MLKRYFPILQWLPNYKKDYLSGDIAAGLTVGVMLIPQGMAYAIIADLPPVFGLYAALVPQLVYAVLGTSRQLAVGPVAMDSLLVASGLGALAISGIDEYISMAIFLALFIGVIQLGLGLLRMGFLVNFSIKTRYQWFYLRGSHYYRAKPAKTYSRCKYRKKQPSACSS